MRRLTGTLLQVKYAFWNVLVRTVKYAMKTLVWMHRKRCVYNMTKTKRFENALVWTKS